MSLLAGITLALGCLAYIFWPDRNPFVQADKTRVDSLRERKDSIYENLRDLNFEYLAGKYPEQDYSFSAPSSKTKPPPSSPKWTPSKPAESAVPVRTLMKSSFSIVPDFSSFRISVGFSPTNKSRSKEKGFSPGPSLWRC